MKELALYQKQFRKGSVTTNKRILGSEFLHKLASTNFGKGVKFPFVVIAIVKTNLSSPANRIVDGVCKLITTGHIATIQHKNTRAAVEQAEKIMEDCRGLLKALKVDPVFQVTEFGRLDVRLILHILKLGKVGEGRVFESLNEIAEALW